MTAREYTATLNERANRIPGIREEWAFHSNELALNEPEFAGGQVWVSNETTRQLSVTRQPSSSEQDLYVSSPLRPYGERTHIEAGWAYNLAIQPDDTEETGQQALGSSVRRAIAWTQMTGSYNRFTTIGVTPSDADLVIIARSGASDFIFEPQPDTLKAEWAEASLNPFMLGHSKTSNVALNLSDLKTSLISDPTDLMTEAIPSFGPGQDISWNLPVMTPNGRVFRVHRIGELVPESPVGESWGQPQTPLHLAVQAFSKGFGGKTPTEDAQKIVIRLAEAAEVRAKASEIEFDETDGVFSFEIRLANGRLVVGELSIEGDLHVNVYYDEHPDPDADLDEIWEKHMPQARAADVIALL